MRFRCVLLVLGLIAAQSSQADAQSSPSDLRGKSILIDVKEFISNRRGPAEISWTQRIYISDQGRLFQKVVRVGSDPRYNRGAETAPDDSQIAGPASQFRWSADGTLVRSWVNWRGRPIQHIISFAKSGEQHACRLDIVRPQGGRGFGTTLENRCRVVSGNVFAGR
ncbi:hypothetical protein [Prosthecomicrobium sp. N25]|uniref:hypothetical protein n=1 Tax=Prosthecomicrobium sp. N25 TaxID=3129254 RepID=UPI003076EC6C